MNRAHALTRDREQPARLHAPARAFYLELEPDSVFAILHEPVESTPSGVGVVFCPPFGWAELCVHRSLRRWAEVLAANGHAALRLDLPGTGDSAGGPHDPARLSAWSEAIAAGGRWLRATQACERVVAIGIGLGGMLALAAIAERAPIDDVVLWGVPRNGSLLLRELRTFAQMSNDAAEADRRQAAPAATDDEVEIAGFVLSGATVRDLRALDLTTLALPDATRRRILMLGRDTLDPDRRLLAHLEACGASVAVAEGPGYGKMLTHPQFAVAPDRVFARTLAWLAESEASVRSSTSVNRAAPAQAPSSATKAALRVGDATIWERPFVVELEHRRLAGVLAMPRADAAEMCAVLLNAGAVRRIGPNRMWVESARLWAARGVPTLRIDGAAFGDSDGDERRYYQPVEVYHDDSLDQIRATLDALEACGLPSRFMLAGLCSSAYWAVQAALVDVRVRALILVNLWSFVWSEELAAVRDARRAQAMLRSGAWLDIARLAVSEGRIGRFARTRLRRLLVPRNVWGAVSAQTDWILDELNEREVQTLLLLSEEEPLAEDFIADGRIEHLERWPTLRYERVPIDDHIFRPVWAQRLVHDALDDALARFMRSASG
jgi:pimeloyl-ACP methyl ester carboxylesterase